jgi:hypothetical protein
MTLLKKFEVPVVAAMYRSQRCPRTYRRPVAMSWRIEGLGPWAASSWAATGGSGRRIQNRNTADTR